MKRFQILFTKILPYASVFVLALALMIFGSRSQNDNSVKPIAANFDDLNFTVTSDQLSESYTVANIANTVDLPSTSSISENYVTINSIYESTGTASSSSSTIVEKPTIIDTSNLDLDKVKSHTVADGENLDTIIAQYNSKATKDQIRWSNGMKNEAVAPGNVLLVPVINGIAYKAKAGDTAANLAEKYSSNEEQIIAYNNLENKGIAVDQVLILPGATVPERERPEYTVPTARPSSGYSRTYSYVYDAGVRHNMIEVGSYSYWSNMYYSTKWQNNPGAFGNCTWFAWYWRRNNMGSEYWLPTGTIGNARNWISTMGGSYYTGRTPAYGAVMQSTSGYYGHVAVVVGVAQGDHITIQEMNYAGPNGKFNHVYQSTINWSDALQYNYIYQHK
ncbi:LysM peptidoglycan-binding domain-containing protein [Candidatus Saccharibacteria bacterium]|nr:LysM peptidoglycan-binding domain-containing protein [Candidatus Saccharibacteria bacterium]